MHLRVLLTLPAILSMSACAWHHHGDTEICWEPYPTLNECYDAELWVDIEGWDRDPVAWSYGETGMICANIDAVPGEVILVNGTFWNSYEVPQDYNGWWWICANYYGQADYEGSFYLDGYYVEPWLVTYSDGGVDCELVVPSGHGESQQSIYY